MTKARLSRTNHIDAVTRLPDVPEPTNPGADQPRENCWEKNVGAVLPRTGHWRWTDQKPEREKAMWFSSWLRNRTPSEAAKHGHPSPVKSGAFRPRLEA
jgi:hypothetical protein